MEITAYKNPIIIDGGMVNQPSDYLSADGDDFYNARGRFKKFFKKAGKVARLHPVVALGTGVKKNRKGIGRGLKKAVKFLPPVAVGRAVMKKLGVDGRDYYDFLGEDYFSIDARNTKEVQDFQIYANKMGYTPALVEDGLYFRKDGKESNTQRAYKQFGADWEKQRQSATGMVGTGTAITTDAPPSNSPAVSNATIQGTSSGNAALFEQQKKEAESKGLVWDKAKGIFVQAKELGLFDFMLDKLGVKQDPDPKPKKLNKTGKTVLIVGGVLIAGLIVYKLVKK